MQNPVGAHFNYHTMRMEFVDFGAVVFNPVAQRNSSIRRGRLCAGSVFVLAVSAGT